MVVRLTKRFMALVAMVLVLTLFALVAIDLFRSTPSQAYLSECREAATEEASALAAGVASLRELLDYVASIVARSLTSDLAIPVAQSGNETITITDPNQLRIFIDRYTQTLTLYEGERELVSYPVAVGKEETPTPPGEWRIIHKDKHWGDGFGTRWMGLNVPWGIYGIHGTNKPWSIGTFASAGCIRMFNKNVEELYDLVPIGTPVIISGDLPEVSVRSSIGPGTSGKFVLVLQVRLRQAGFDVGSLDGRFGPAVTSGVRNFQALYGLLVDGTVTRDQQRILSYP